MTTGQKGDAGAQGNPGIQGARGKTGGSGVVIAIGMMFATMLVMTALNIFYADHLNRQSNNNFCDIVVTVNDAYRDNPPSTDLGRKLQQNYADLERRLQCR